MSDQYEQETTEGEVAEQTAKQEVPSPSYLTKDEAEQLFQRKVDEALNRQVGLYTKGTEKLRQRLQSLEEHLQMQKDAGITVDPAAAERMRSSIISKTLTEPDEVPSQSQSATAQPQQRNDGINPQQVNSIAANLLQTLGVKFSEKDPELKMIKTNGDPMEYLDSLTKAASAWKERNSDIPNPEARIPGLVTGSTSEKDLKAAYDKELKAAQADPFNAKEKALQIRRKYRALGLPGL